MFKFNFKFGRQKDTHDHQLPPVVPKEISAPKRRGFSWGGRKVHFRGSKGLRGSFKIQTIPDDSRPLKPSEMRAKYPNHKGMKLRDKWLEKIAPRSVRKQTA